eukprot:Pompholyxophrys_punicea_v1_NODE_792_length_1287_cov_3.979708.p1 type:complete len:164 gc:universal NODE_792_length_1287_cov_3.979708:1164-673(-)
MAKIYKIVNNKDAQEYVGATTGNLDKRLVCHISESRLRPETLLYTHMNKIGHKNFSIILLEECPYVSRKQINVRKMFWVESLKPSLNSEIFVTLETEEARKTAEKEWKKKYDRIYKRKKIECECGMIVSRAHMKTHKSRSIHENRMKNEGTDMIEFRCAKNRV